MRCALPWCVFRAVLALLCGALVTACGGGGGGGDGGASGSESATAPGAGAAQPAACSVADQKGWLGSYMNEWYFWARLSPQPNAAAYADLESYFRALLYTGTDSRYPADRYSGSQSTDSFNRFFGDGATLGYGVSVAGLELALDGTQPLYVRHVEPASPAGLQGVQRGDRVLSINGRSAASVIAADDYAALTPAQAGDSLTLVLQRGGVDRTRVLSAAVFALMPVPNAVVMQSAAGRRLGYVAVKDMISQALAPIDGAFAQLKAAGVQDLVLDLRYNGGGLVSTGGTLASYVAGARGSGRNYATLLYNDQRAAINNQNFPFTSPAAALGLSRVFVLTGRRTCSASEQVINGLRGVGVDVVAIGETTCGKPVGFLPVSQCARTYSVVNFESVNQRNEGRYFDGFAATCRVAEDFTAAQGSATDPLLAAASRYADTGACPAVAAGTGAAGALAQRNGAAAGPGPQPEAGEQQGMLGR